MAIVVVAVLVDPVLAQTSSGGRRNRNDGDKEKRAGSAKSCAIPLGGGRPLASPQSLPQRGRARRTCGWSAGLERRLDQLARSTHPSRE